MYTGYGGGGRIQDRETELDMSGFLHDIGAEDLPSFDSDPGDAAASRRSPPSSPRRGSPMRRTQMQSPGFLDESFSGFMEEMGVDDFPSFDSDRGGMQPMRFNELPSFGSGHSGEVFESTHITSPQQTRTPPHARRIPMSAFLESPTGEEIDYRSPQRRALPATPEHLKKNLHISGLSGMTDFFEELEELEKEHPRDRAAIDHDTFMRETEELLAGRSPVRPKQISPRTRELQQMFPSMYQQPKSPTPPRRPPSPVAQRRTPASPGRYPARAPSPMGMPRAASSPRKRSPGPAPFSRPPSAHPPARQPPQPSPYQREPGDLMELDPSAFADYYDFIGHQPLHERDLMEFKDQSFDWTASSMRKSKTSRKSIIETEKKFSSKTSKVKQ